MAIIGGLPMSETISILDTHDGVCYACQRHIPTELHHIIYGTGLRPIADKYGLTCYLCPECHRGTKGVHGRDGNALNRALKCDAQRKYESIHGHDAWMQLVGRDFL